MRETERTFCKAHMRAFCYSIRDMNYRQMRAYALYGIQPSVVRRAEFSRACVAKVASMKYIYG